MSDAYEKFIRGVHAALLLIAVIALLLLCLFLWHLDLNAKQLNKDLVAAQGTIVALHGAAKNLENTLVLERQAATAQIATANQAAASLAQASAAVNTLIAHTDAQLNGAAGVLPALRDTIQHQDEGFSALERQAGANLADLDTAEKSIFPALANFNQASLELAQQLPPILSDVKSTTGSTVVIAANTADTSHELDLSAQDFHAWVHRELAPVRGTWNLIKGSLMEFLGPAAQVATAARAPK